LEEHPLLRPHLYDESMHLRKHVLVFYNDDNLATIGDRNVALKSGDRLLVLQAVSGG
jgi:sulfur carrier protein ThiS